MKLNTEKKTDEIPMMHAIIGEIEQSVITEGTLIWWISLCNYKWQLV